MIVSPLKWQTCQHNLSCLFNIQTLIPLILLASFVCMNCLTSLNLSMAIELHCYNHTSCYWITNTSHETRFPVSCEMVSHSFRRGDNVLYLWHLCWYNNRNPHKVWAILKSWHRYAGNKINQWHNCLLLKINTFRIYRKCRKLIRLIISWLNWFSNIVCCQFHVANVRLASTTFHCPIQCFT